MKFENPKWKSPKIKIELEKQNIIMSISTILKLIKP